MSDRVVVFIDYQNVYMGAREAFHARSDPGVAGQIDPVGLAELLTRESPFERHLHQVRVYRGQPDPTRDERGHAAFTRQVEAWQDPRVVTTQRPLLYPGAGRSRGRRASTSRSPSTSW